MSATSPCVPCCSTPVPVNVPGIAGVDGTDGAAGADGLDAYTFTTTNTTVPAIGANVTVDVINSLWMVVGQVVVMTGPAYFQVVSKPGPTQAVLKFLGYALDVAPATVINSGAGVSPGGSQPVVTGFAASGANADITSLTALSTPLSVAQGGTGGNSIHAAAAALGFRTRLLGKIIGANFDSTGDQAIAGFPTKYIVRRIVATNASLNMTTAQGGFYTGAAKTGTTIVAAGQVYTALSAATKFVDLTIAAGALSDVLVATTIYFALTVAQGAAATGDLYVFGDDLQT